MMECYQAYADYQDIMRLVEDMYAFIAETGNGRSGLCVSGYPDRHYATLEAYDAARGHRRVYRHRL